MVRRVFDDTYIRTQTKTHNPPTYCAQVMKAQVKIIVLIVFIYHTYFRLRLSYAVNKHDY